MSRNCIGTMNGNNVSELPLTPLQQHGGVATLAFFDLEATGLPSEQSRVRITELAVVAVTVADLKAASPRIPRIQHKVTMCTNPCSPIHPVATQVSGLDNFMLERHPNFDNTTCDALEAFLGRLPAPVCLVAHNGHCFDFPLLAKEFNCAKRTFPKKILCADTLPCFRQLLDSKKVPVKEIPRRRLNFDEPSQVNSQIDLGSFESTEFDDEMAAVAEAVEREYYLSQQMVQLSTAVPLPVTPTQLAMMQEHTPQRKKPKSFKLGDLVEQLAPHFRADALHSAEGDVMALLHCASAVAHEFIPWVNDNAKWFPLPRM